MEKSDRITVDAAELTALIENQLDRFKVFQFDSRLRSLLGETLIDRLTVWDKQIRQRRNDPFTLVVCGEFKRGKSSLINALLGEDVVPTNVTAETVTLNRIQYGPHRNEVRLSQGRKMTLSDAEIERESLEALMQETQETFRQIDLQRPIDFLKQVTIIDTPGLSDSLSDFSELVDQALCQADAVLYVFSVRYPLAQSEQLFLKAAILPQKYTDLMLVGNFADTLQTEDEQQRMEQMLTQRIEGLLPDQKPWLLSALDECCHQRQEERPNLVCAESLAKNFDHFRQALVDQIEQRQEWILPDRMQRMVRGMIAELNQNIQAMQEGLTLDHNQLQQRLEILNQEKAQRISSQQAFNQRLDDLIDQMQAEAWGWMDEVLNQMQSQVQGLKRMKAEDLMKYYTFYCIDTIQEAISRCIDHHTVLIYDELDALSRELTARLSQNQVQSGYNFRFALDNRTWTMGDNVSFVVSKLSGLGLLSLVADGIAGAMRQKEMTDKTPQIIQSIASQYPQLTLSVQKTLQSIYGQLKDTVKKQLMDYYQEQLDQFEQQSEQIAKTARQSEDQKAQIKAALDQLNAVLQDIERLLASQFENMRK
ncbi:dynamin family protein [Holdemania massiliensis]|uniref:dynamin family protein n=1 Tax=Holdemania massiliensis TaxID=1468449 RepID=UPI001F066CFB|nr:dynamin family protein [Holdemania massiliensis]MCH1939130.1 dynamin family protein [Holdemania massiliensis]